MPHFGCATKSIHEKRRSKEQEEHEEEGESTDFSRTKGGVRSPSVWLSVGFSKGRDGQSEAGAVVVFNSCVHKCMESGRKSVNVNAGFLFLFFHSFFSIQIRVVGKERKGKITEK
mmetsp:Transcript_14333/g.28811  ORF Transcript_14333/g.28811 Transcript_14333/m.28811 type:complete len:115 (+) Transcript_14333:517-861(+)